MNKKEFFMHGRINNSEKSSRITVAAISKKDMLCFGVSRCSKNDNFCKKTGRDLSLDRANNNPILSVASNDDLLVFKNIASLMVNNDEFVMNYLCNKKTEKKSVTY